MPKTIYLSESDSSGISITWTPTVQRIDISAWYDSMVGIPRAVGHAVRVL